MVMNDQQESTSCRHLPGLISFNDCSLPALAISCVLARYPRFLTAIHIPWQLLKGTISIHPHFLRRPDKDEAAGMDTTGPNGLVKAIKQLSAEWFVPSLRIDSLKSLREIGVPETIVEALRQVIRDGAQENHVVVQFLYLLVMSEFGKGLKREVQRAIRKAYKDIKPEHGLRASMEDLLSCTPPWGGLSGTVGSARHDVTSA